MTASDLPDRATPEPWADRERWYPVLYIGGEARLDMEATMPGDTGSDIAEMVANEGGHLIQILVARRSALPVRRHDGIWWSPGAKSEDFGPDFSHTADGDFGTVTEVRDAWLDAVAVAAARNQRAEEKR